MHWNPPFVVVVVVVPTTTTISENFPNNIWVKHISLQCTFQEKLMLQSFNINNHLITLSSR
jgi:hypothetical protein